MINRVANSLPKLGPLSPRKRRQRRLSTPRALLLMYHRIANPPLDPWGLAVSPSLFLQHLNVLRQWMHPISLSDFVQGCLWGNLPPRAVVLTLDDGYRDNFTHAFPLLEKFNVPATIFISTGYTGTEQPFWWDELTHILLQTPHLPHTLTLIVAGTPYTWDLTEPGDISTSKQHASWYYEQEAPTRRHALYLELWNHLARASHTDRQKALSDLRNWSSSRLTASPDELPLRPTEIQALNNSELITIGAHTITHTSLSGLPASQQHHEISQSKLQLEQWTASPVSFFSYPHGEYDETTLETMRKSGLIAACGVTPEPAGYGTDLFQLPRIQIRNWPSLQFRQVLERYMQRIS